MRMLCTILILACMPAFGTAAEIVIENARVKAVLGEDAVWRSVVSKATGRELCSPEHPKPVGQAFLCLTTAEIGRRRAVRHKNA